MLHCEHAHFEASSLSFASWMWLKIKQGGLGRFWSMFPLTRVPVFEPQPHACRLSTFVDDLLDEISRRAPCEGPGRM